MTYFNGKVRSTFSTVAIGLFCLSGGLVSSQILAQEAAQGRGSKSAVSSPLQNTGPISTSGASLQVQGSYYTYHVSDVLDYGNTDLGPAKTFYKNEIKAGNTASAQMAAFQLGMAYLDGRRYLKTIKPDEIEAIQWFKNAGDGDANGSLLAYYVGYRFLGQGLPVIKPDAQQAEHWLLVASASQSFGIEVGEAEYNLGFAYLKGDVLSQDISKGIQWLLQSAKRGNAHATLLLGQLYRDGALVPRNAELAQQFFDAVPILAKAEEAETQIDISQAQAFRAEVIQQDKEAKEQQRKAIANGIANGVSEGLSNASSVLSTPNSIQTSTDQQLTNVSQAEIQSQRLRVQQAVQTAQKLQASQPKQQVLQTSSLGQDSIRPVIKSGTAPAANPLPTNSATNINTLCPASGFIPGVMTHPAPDVALGVQCKPGSVIYINGVPQFDTTGTGPGSVSAGANGNNGGTTTSPTDGPPEAACIQLSADPTNTYPVFHNTCTFAVTYFWTPFKIPPGGYAEQNGILQSGETQTGAETAVGGYRIYACQTNYLVRGPDGSPITGVVSGYRCVKP